MIKLTDEPNYEDLRKLFKKILIKHNIKNYLEVKYDWVIFNYLFILVCTNIGENRKLE